MAQQGGASALLVFPSGIFTFGQRPEMAIAHFKRIADSTDLPLIVFQYPLAGGQGYPLETLLKIIEAVPTVRAVKDWCANPQLHERQIRTLQTLKPPVNLLTTHSAWLLSSLVLGCNGLLSGSGSVIARQVSAASHIGSSINAIRRSGARRARICCGRCHTKSQRKWEWTTIGSSAPRSPPTKVELFTCATVLNLSFCTGVSLADG